MRDLLIAVLVVVLLFRLAENLLDLALVQLARWLVHRRVPEQIQKLRIELELQRSKIPEQVRAHCAATGCTSADEHITEQLAAFDTTLETRLTQTEKVLREQAGQ